MKLLTPLISIFLAASALAQTTIPANMTYQGRLTDSNNVAVPDGSGYEIEVRLWTAGSGVAGETVIWGTRYTDVPVRSGAFNIILGSGGTPISGAQTTDLKQAFNTTPVHLGIKMTKNATGVAVTASELIPRQQVFSSPFAFRADKAEDSAKLGGQPAAFYSPTGSIIAFAGSTAPAGWLLCDGSTITSSAYPTLFSIIGISYGTDGGGTFKLPDLRGRFPLGTNPAPQPPVPTPRPLAQVGGEETHTLTIAEMPAHNHDERYNSPGPSGNVGPYAAGQTFASQAWRVLRSDTFDQSSNLSIAPQGGNAPHRIMPPFLVLNFIIKY